MNYIKAQKEVFNELLNGRRIGGFNIDENNILVSPDGFRAYIFPVSTIAFSLEKIQKISAFPVAELIKPENELKLTNDLRILDRRSTARRLKKQNGASTFVNSKFLECFQAPKFFQGESNLTTIVVTESIRVDGKYTDVPVGIILPIRATWDDGTYYGDKVGV